MNPKDLRNILLAYQVISNPSYKDILFDTLKQLFSAPRTSNNCNNSTFLGRFLQQNSCLCRLIFILYWNVVKETPALEEEN